eukprot:7012419-Alexandrium_andersonii.AAC.1
MPARPSPSGPGGSGSAPTRRARASRGPSWAGPTPACPGSGRRPKPWHSENWRRRAEVRPGACSGARRPRGAR